MDNKTTTAHCKASYTARLLGRPQARSRLLSPLTAPLPRLVRLDGFALAVLACYGIL